MICKECRQPIDSEQDWAELQMCDDCLADKEAQAYEESMEPHNGYSMGTIGAETR